MYRVYVDNEIVAALARCKTAFIGVAVMSGLVNILYLTGSFFMLEVYDRMIPSRLVPILIGLAALALVFYAFQGVLEALRGRILARVGAAVDEALSGRVFDLAVRAPLKGTTQGDGLLPLRNLDHLRAFLSGSDPSAFFDLPWMSVYLLICFLFHPLIGVAALICMGILIALTFLTDRASKGPTRAATGHSMRRNALAEADRRNVEVLAAMGMQERLAARWAGANREYMEAHQTVSDAGSGFGAGSNTACISIRDDQKECLAGLRLMPGMPVESYTQIGERSVLSHLTRPLTDQTAKA